jgi:hypothetical protein
MSDGTQYAAAFLEGVLKVLPALLAAFYAYRLWYFKMAQDRADSIIKGCLILQHFCFSLERHLADDPNRLTAVAIESINTHVDSILSTATASAMLDNILETYYLWKKGAYFPASRDNEADLQRRRSALKKNATDCARVVTILRSRTPQLLARTRFSSL